MTDTEAYEVHTKKGYYYVRDTEWYQREEVVKLGITECIVSRSATYITGEIKKGCYLMVFEVPWQALRGLDRWMKEALAGFHIQHEGAGTEFYARSVLSVLDAMLQQTGIAYRKLTVVEMLQIERKATNLLHPPSAGSFRKRPVEEKEHDLPTTFATRTRIHTDASSEKSPSSPPPPVTVQQETASNLIPKNEPEQGRFLPPAPVPTEEQERCLTKALSYYRTHTHGKLCRCCGTGKTLISLFLSQRLNAQRIVIGVPSRYLRTQFYKEIFRIFARESTQVLFLGSEAENANEKIASTTNLQRVKEFLTLPGTKFIVTTYTSCHLLAQEDLEVDFKIADEAHHLVGTLNTAATTGYRMFHRIHSRYTLFMTATEKIIEGFRVAPLANSVTYSMDDPAVFGERIDEPLTVKWAIENKKITDYVLLVLKNTEADVDQILARFGIAALPETTDASASTSTSIFKELFISAYMSLLSFLKYPELTHLLLYTNTTESAELANHYLSQLLQLDQFASLREAGLYHQALHSNNCRDMASELASFRESTRGIISCVYIFGEGFDEPALNGVCIAENMNSEIRITQYVLRPNRLHPFFPNKLAYLILPYIDTEDWNDSTPSYEKIRTIVSHLRNDDDMIEQKMSLLRLAAGATDDDEPKRKRRLDPPVENQHEEDSWRLEENEEELKKIKIRLRRSKALKSKMTEQEEEYHCLVQINQVLQLQSVAEYVASESRHPCYVADPKSYFTKSGTWKSWYHFLGMDVSRFIPDKETWATTCRKLGITTFESYLTATASHPELPKDPGEFYVGFGTFTHEVHGEISRRRS